MSRFFFQERMRKKEKRATSKQNALHIKLPFLSLCFLVYFPFRGVLLERLFDRGDRSSLLQREDVFFGRFPVVQLVVLLGHFISLLIKPLLFQSAKTKRRREQNDRRNTFLVVVVVKVAGKSCACACVCVFARARDVLNSEEETSSNFFVFLPPHSYMFRVLVHPFLLESKKEALAESKFE